MQVLLRMAEELAAADQTDNVTAESQHNTKQTKPKTSKGKGGVRSKQSHTQPCSVNTHTIM